MSTLMEELTAIKAVEDKLTANKVANFAYTDHAYNNPLTEADGVETYDVDNEQNIPVANASILKVNTTILTKGWRAQASAITRMLMNHFLGRCSYNLNKINDLFSQFLTNLMAFMGQPNGLATLDSYGRSPNAVGSDKVFITRGLLGAVFGKLLCRTWAQGTNVYLRDAIYVNGLWVSGSNDSGCWWSEDGKAWTQGTGDNTSYKTVGVHYANGIWVCCVEDNGFWWSEDGKTWTQGTGDNTALDMNPCIYVNGLWVGGSYNSGCWWSEDGKAWTQGTGDVVNERVTSMSYENGIWVCAGTKHCFWSEDGKSWTASKGGTNYQISSFTYANGLWFCTEKSSANVYTFYYSEDGKIWTPATGLSSKNCVARPVYAKGLWVAGFGGPELYWSEDGKAWTQGTATLTFSPSFIYYANGLWICSSLWSEDGKTWTQGTTSVGSNVRCINGLWVCSVSSYNSSTQTWERYSYLSDNGKDWSEMPLEKLSHFTTLSSFIYANGIVLALCDTGAWYSSIEDLITDGTIDLGADIPIVNS